LLAQADTVRCALWMTESLHNKHTQWVLWTDMNVLTENHIFLNSLYILFFSSFVSEILWRPSTKMFKYSSMVMNTKKQIWTKTWLVVVLASSSRHCNMFIVHEFCGQYIFSLAKTQMLLNCHKIFKCVKSNAIRSFVDRKMLKRKCAIVWFWSQT